MDAWKLVAGALVALGVLQVLAAVGAASLRGAVTTLVTGALFVAVGLLAFYRADVGES